MFASAGRTTHSLPRSGFKWSSVTLRWPGMPVRGANQKLPLIAPLRWLTFAFEWVACSDSVSGGKEEKNKVKEAESGRGLRRGVSSPVQVSSVPSLWIFSMPVRVSANAVLGYSTLVLLPSSHPQSLSYYSSTSSDGICFRATDPIYERYESLESVPMKKPYTLDIVAPANSGTNSLSWPVVSNTCRYQHDLCCGGLTPVL